jgi:AcrR family transcriptional regulator
VTAAKTAQRGADEDKSNFRQRLLDALEQGIAEDGYPRTTVADIVRRARTSRRTFYEHFDSREACFVALLTDANAEQVRQISAAVDAHTPWRSQVRQAIEAWISSGESRPALMLSWIRDVPSLGAGARRLQRDAMENFVGRWGIPASFAPRASVRSPDSASSCCSVAYANSPRSPSRRAAT